jgi:hypothetical protein
LTVGLVHGHNEQVIFTTTMTASISKAPSGAVYAFNGEPMRPCSMVHNTSVVDAMLQVTEMQQWVTTLEEILPEVPVCHYGTLSLMIVRLQVYLDRHQAQHEAIVTDAPTADDLQAYLAAYAAAITK